MPCLIARRTLAGGLLLAAAIATTGLALGQTNRTPQDQRVAGQAVAIFAGGCFWCMEEAFEKVPGVSSVVSGYTGGTLPNPTYEQVGTKKTGHAEAVQVTYDPGEVSYAQLVDWFWHNIDPVDAAGQFCDKGSPYRSAVFVHDQEQRRIAEESKKALEASGRFTQPIATEIVAAGPFYPAEAYHQDYYKVNPIRYRYYKYGCGRAARLEQIWGKPTPPTTQ